jgi:hypothetical protein
MFQLALKKGTPGKDMVKGIVCQVNGATEKT